MIENYLIYMLVLFLIFNICSINFNDFKALDCKKEGFFYGNTPEFNNHLKKLTESKQVQPNFNNSDAYLGFLNTSDINDSHGYNSTISNPEKCDDVLAIGYRIAKIMAMFLLLKLCIISKSFRGFLTWNKLAKIIFKTEIISIGVSIFFVHSLP